MSDSPAAPKQHYIFLDGLRGVAALMVLLLHWFEGNGKELFGSGLLAVDFFFILSGFVVALAYEQRLLAQGRSAQFIRQRFIRLYPMIAAGVLLGFTRFAMLSFQESGSPINEELVTQLVGGLAMIPFDLDGGVAGFFPLNNALWSLHFEFIAYLAFWLVLYRVNIFGLAVIALVAMLGCYVWAMMTFGPADLRSAAGDTATGYIHALSRVAFSFTLGMIIFRCRDRTTGAVLPGGRWLALLLVAALVLPRDLVPPLAVMALLALVFPYIIAAGTKVVHSGPFTGAEKMLGDLSYPLYALHVPLIWTMNGACKTLGIGFTQNPFLNGLFILPLTLAISYAAFLLYDRPLRRWLTARFTSRRTVVPAAIGDPIF
ncbi:acyltransferase [Sphingopyxis sp. JAI128]|uniref:acyltransferase family protein n=1 Tax=Sphingopyxis sp. JAI128 TaxID=2723066 RepID=UPI001617E2D4|nr:acyltransferase [Sphingopyxis sp. JAI128]MBB6427200.1 peptidoglycan/LPS O-acetylase OafA/YrhL [Sphingopyxis sp. JAI128]